MNKILLNLAISLIQRLLSKDVWATLSSIIDAAESMDSEGALKRNWVLSQIDHLPPEIRDAMKATAGWLINLALEAIVARLRVKAG